MKASVKASLDCKAAWLKYHLNWNKSSVVTWLLGEVCSKCNPILVELCLCSNDSRYVKYITNEIEAEVCHFLKCFLDRFYHNDYTSFLRLKSVTVHLGSHQYMSKGTGNIFLLILTGSIRILPCFYTTSCIEPNNPLLFSVLLLKLITSYNWVLRLRKQLVVDSGGLTT